MPNPKSDKYNDLRGERFESEIRMSDLTSGKGFKKVYMCSNCHKIFAERSSWCPRCGTKTMGWIAPREKR